MILHLRIYFKIDIKIDLQNGLKNDLKMKVFFDILMVHCGGTVAPQNRSQNRPSNRPPKRPQKGPQNGCILEGELRIDEGVVAPGAGFILEP